MAEQLHYDPHNECAGTERMSYGHTQCGFKYVYKEASQKKKKLHSL